ncbi:DUF503 domain-containing protein [Microbacterium sp. SS28]|uniref:DUF503 domain-containing protein n=1 Tax=Microbacterium sp. SS28 TaxID=2919948 RepID=UPI001FAAB030|nr:DUF503 domain-containing protein [Microbacterium sp. SS28]
MWVGWIEFDILLGDVHSLKEKRSVIRPLIAELRRRTEASVAEVGLQDLHRRTGIGVAVVSGDPAHVRHLLDHAEAVVLEHPELTLLAAHRKLQSSGDD